MTEIRRTFMDRALAGEFGDRMNGAIYDEIDAWHEAADHLSMPLHDWLGMREDEWRRWVERVGALAAIVAARRSQ